MDKQSLKKLLPLLKHLGITVGVGVIIILIFFYWLLPFITNHGETITVPDIKGMHVDDLDDVLLERSLRYEVNQDSGYSADEEPLVVLEQFPKPHAKVKEKRKVYVTLNAEKPPLVKMPDLVNKSLKIAQITLKSYGLKLGKTKYRPDIALNSVLAQEWDGRRVLPGEKIPKGSFIDLYVGDGHGNKKWNMFSYVDLPLDEAKIAIVGAGLRVGTIRYEASSAGVVPQENDSGDTVRTVVDVSIGDVVRHNPSWGDTVRLKDAVDLWVYQPDSLVNENSLLDNEE